MSETDALVIFYISILIGAVGVGFGFGFLFSIGTGWLALTVYSIISIPTGIWFNNNLDKFLR